MLIISRRKVTFISNVLIYGSLELEHVTESPLLQHVSSKTFNVNKQKRRMTETAHTSLISTHYSHHTHLLQYTRVAIYSYNVHAIREVAR